jgi:hypothetical protein
MTPRSYKGPALEVNEKWHVGHDSEVTIKNEVFRVMPDDEERQILAIRFIYTSTADVGNRQIVCKFQSRYADPIYYAYAGLVQAASKVYTYSFAPGLPDATTLRVDSLTTPIPFLVLKPWDAIYILDDNGIEATDDIEFEMQYLYRKV